MKKLNFLNLKTQGIGSFNFLSIKQKTNTFSKFGELTLNKHYDFIQMQKRKYTASFENKLYNKVTYHSPIYLIMN